MTSSLDRSCWIDADAYLFDIDGTLLNSRDGVHYNAFHAALSEIYGTSAKIDSVHVHGNTDIGILRAVAQSQGIADQEFESKLPLAMERMCACARQDARSMSPSVCPSVGELLAALKGQNKLLGVVSGNLEAIGWLKLEAAGLRDFFDFGSFSGARELRVDIFRHGIAEASKRSRPAARVCFVGDTPDDVAAARQLGTPVIAVATGIYSVEQLTAAGPDICVGCCADLMSCLPGMSSAQS